MKSWASTKFFTSFLDSFSICIFAIQKYNTAMDNIALLEEFVNMWVNLDFFYIHMFVLYLPFCISVHSLRRTQ